MLVSNFDEAYQLADKMFLEQKHLVYTLFILPVISLMPICSSALEFKHISRVIQPKTSAETQAQTVSDLIRRIIGSRSTEFSVNVDPSIGSKDRDTFKLVLTSNHSVVITGTSGVAAAWGFYYYINQYAGAHVSWGGLQVNLPKPLPALPSAEVIVTSNDKFRYYLNVCTMSYSFVWYNWDSWETQLDWMAIHAINLPLAFVGQEAIWHRVYLKMGFTQDELDSHFAGPAFLAWQRMGNMHGWGGPLPAAWLTEQVTLQHQILQRMRNFGMTPVLPAFAGHVPANITRLFPSANVTRAGDWGGFNATYCCSTLLDFSDPLFTKIGKSFIEEYTAEFGTDHVYNCDSFNENSPPSGDPAFIAAAGRQVFQAMTAADPDAIWVMQGWLFFHNNTYWTVDHARALLTSIPQGRMIVLDMPSDMNPQYSRLQSYFGQPFIWTMLHNFGGNVALYGALSTINEGPFKGRTITNSSMLGIGLTMEGIFQNNVMYEFMMEHTWRKEPWNITSWLSDYHQKRYGHFNTQVDSAWQLLKRSVYNCTDPMERHGHGKNLIVLRPRLKQKIDVWYNPIDLYNAWDYLVDASDNFVKSDLFRYDLVDVTRQSLQVLAIKYYTDLNAAFKAKDLNKTQMAGKNLISLVLDMDKVLGSDSHFLLGHWLEAAKAKGASNAEKKLYEYNARNQITLWGPDGNILDYANKQWSGMMADYYGARWVLFVRAIINSLRSGTGFDRNKYYQDVFKYVEQPFTFSNKMYSTKPVGDSISIVRKIHSKYRPVTTRHSIFFSKLQHWSSNKGKFIGKSMHYMRKLHLGDEGWNESLPKSDVLTKYWHKWSHENLMSSKK